MLLLRRPFPAFRQKWGIKWNALVISAKSSTGVCEMDFAFAPGRTGYDSLMRQLFTNRPNTQLVQDRTLRTVADFLNRLHTGPGITLPAEDLYIVSHGNNRAWIQIHLDTTQTTDTTYEAADAAVAGNTDPFGTGVTAGSVQIPNDVNHDSSGNLNGMAMNFRGCRIGAAGPFVDKLKEAFGNESPVTAPKHFHEVFQLGNIGMMEFLIYGFSVVNKTAFADKTAVGTALDAAGLTYKDGSAIPSANWTDWVPTNVGVGHRTTKQVFVNLGTTLGTQSKIRQSIDFRHDVARFTYRISGLSPIPAPPDRLDTLRQALNNDAAQPGSNFASTHPLPMYARYSQSSIDDFVDNLSWTFSTDASQTLICVGSQHEYTVLVPIVDPPDLATGNLIFNFYPSAGSTAAAVTNLTTGDDTMFYTA